MVLQVETEPKTKTRAHAKKTERKSAQALRACHTSREDTHKLGVDEGFVPSPLELENEGLEEIAAELETALESGQFFIVYQPLFGLTDGVVTGAEAFVRWQHPQRGIVAPDAFIPLAEVCGMGSQIDAFVINEALRQLAEWSAPIDDWDDFNSWDEFMISVNISSQGLRDPYLLAEIEAALERHGILPSQLCLEITATALIGAGDVNEVVGALSVLGVHLAFDAFVTNSAFMSSRQFRADTLKIDRDFVTGLSGEAQNREDVKSVIAMAHALGMTVIGEGIETDSDLENFKGLDCDRGQGYLLSPPITSDIFTDRHRRVSR
jgi:EAL domain-containing protein (putative c-di-GMP-specific phosphodiesterase class I)